MKKLIFVLAAVSTFAVMADLIDRPGGIRIGQRMVLKPSVSLSYTYDSNVDSLHSNSKPSSSLNINPNLDLSYQGENWGIDAGVYYQYHAYLDNRSDTDQLDNSSYGERVALHWADDGWSAMLNQNYRKISQDDDMTNDGGRGVGRDRNQFDFAGAIMRQFTEKWHGGINASYYWLDYVNNVSSYAPMYGWSRWVAGAEVGYVASPWTDILLHGNYQGYTQDNGDDMSGTSSYRYGRESHGATVHIGLGSHATERITYRVLGGWSHYSYGSGDTCNGFTYTVSANWKMVERWQMMLLAASYYQPSETSYGSANRNDTVSWGLGHTLIRSKLNATLDLSYRHQTAVISTNNGDDTSDDIFTGRIGLNYYLNRFLSAFTTAEYQFDFVDGTGIDGDYDYDRWRLTAGMRLAY